MIPDRLSPSLPPSFSFLEEGGGGGFSAGRSLVADSLSSGESALVLKEMVDEAVCEGRVSEVWCSGEYVSLGGSFGRQRFSMEMGKGFVYNPLAIKEPDGEWNVEDKLVSGMSQEDVSKWVLKRISGFGKFLGVSFDGFEDRTMQLFSDIEEK
ncbi:hypothetical protein RHGRI_026295 [Rhododendron griersonianum]|uniref:Uncharacterized protein n=1 Tax=Rhododendron griersonianum TaxID=479676 RepID=A0AAV6ISC1_9ERIC|nr:hypothetical protein RHGRI_026295 [Rhododendron griersonianum]